MKKIRNIQELQAEKKKILQEQKYLENEMHENWKDLKESVRPINIAKDTLNSIFSKKTTSNYKGESLIKNAVGFSLSLLARKIINKAEEKLGNIFKK